MNQKIIIGNWKNYLNYEESILLSKAISNINISDKTRVMISPNHLYLKEVNEILNKTNVEVIAQNLTLFKFIIRYRWNNSCKSEKFKRK